MPGAREKRARSASYILVLREDPLEAKAYMRKEVCGTAVEAGIQAGGCVEEKQSRSGPAREPHRRQCEDNCDQAIQVTLVIGSITGSSTQQPLS